MKISKIIIATALITSLSVLTVFATSDVADVTKIYDVKWDKTLKITKEQVLKKHDVIMVDGKKYKAVNANLIEKKREKIEKDVEFIAEKDIPKTIEKNNIKYNYVKLKEEKNIDVEYKLKYYNMLVKPEIPKEKTFIKDGKSYNGELQNVTRNIGDTYNVQFTIPAKFYGDEETLEYDLKGKLVSAKYAPQFTNYKLEVLNYLNLNKDIYKIDNGEWTSDFKKDANGNIFRDAKFTGMAKSDTYTAIYIAKVKTAKAVYESESISKAKFSVTYDEMVENSITKFAIEVGIGLAIIYLISIFILIIKNKKRQE